MAGDSPLSMMQAAPRPLRKRPVPPPRRLWRYCAPIAIIIALAVGWSWLWYYAASIADRALTGWIEREAAVGRVYACGTQSIGGFPFSIVSRCTDAAAEFKNNRPPFDVKAGDVTFSAQVFRPTLLTGEIGGPATPADLHRQLDRRALEPARPAAGAGTHRRHLAKAAARSRRRSQQRHDLPGR